MEHFDDMLRNTLANDYPENRFEFREEYWLQAQALIESYERKRKRRAIFWIFTGLLLTTAAILYFYDGDTPEQSVPEVQPAVQQTLQQPMADLQESAHDAGRISQPTLETSATLSAATSSTHPSTALPNTNIASNNRKSKINNTVQERIHNNSTENNSPVASTQGSSQKTALQTPQPGLQPDANIPSPDQPGAANTIAAPGRVALQPSQTIESLTLLGVNSLSPVQLPELAMLPTGPSAVLAEVSNITKKAREHKWHTGLTALAGNSDNFLKKDNFSFGLGITNQFKINKKWSLNADLLWRRRNAPALSIYPGLPVGIAETDAIIFDEQIITYSFGYNNTHTTTTLEAMHFAELPIYVSRHFGKWAAEAGGMITTPILSKTHTERNESNSLNKIETTTDAATQYQLNAKQAGNSILPGLVAGINFEPFRNLSIGMRGTYTAVSQNEYILAFRNLSQEPLKLNRSLSPFSADIRVRWLF